jgi:hypothetical protein
MVEPEQTANYQLLTSETERPRNILALLGTVFCSALAFTTTQTIQFSFTDEYIALTYVFAFGELAGALFLGLIPSRIWLKLVLGAFAGLVGGFLLVVCGVWGLNSAAMYVIGRVALGVWSAGSMLAAINYMT